VLLLSITDILKAKRFFDSFPFFLAAAKHTEQARTLPASQKKNAASASNQTFALVVFKQKLVVCEFGAMNKSKTGEALRGRKVQQKKKKE
jgi:hypothetical protein